MRSLAALAVAAALVVSPAAAADATPSGSADAAPAEATPSAPADPVPADAAPAAAPAPAATPAAPPRGSELEVRVIGSRADALQRHPGSGTIVTERDITRARPVDTAEMLRRIPGVQVRQEYSGGSRLDVSIRGLESGRSRRVLMLQDGIPMALNPYSEPDLNDAPAIERYRAIEVVKGSGNILFGPQTLVGTINFLTITPPENTAVTVDVDAGNYGYLRSLARYGDRVADTRYVVQVLDRRGDGFRDQPFASQDALAKIAFPTGRDGEAVLRLGYHRDEADSDDVGLTGPMYARTPRRATLKPNDHLIANRYEGALIHEQRLGEATKLKTLAYAYATDRIWRRQDYTRVPNPAERYERIVVDGPGSAIGFRGTNTILDRDYVVMGVEPRFEHRVKTGPVAHTLDFGGRLLRETAHYQTRAGTYPQSFAGSLGFEEKHAGLAFAGYVQDRIAFRDGLLVTPGIRYENLSFRRTILRQPTERGVEDVYVEGERTVTGVIPGVGMTAGSKALNGFGGVHVGFAPPRTSSAISARGTPADVGAERSMNYELGLRAAAERAFRGQVAGYLSNFNNQVIVNTAPGAETVLADAGATRLHGVETAAQVGVDKLLGIPTIVEIGARYTYSRAAFRYGPNAGKLLPYAPEHAFSTNVDVEHESGLGGQLAYSFTGPQFADAAETVAQSVDGKTGRISERHIVDATVHYRHKPTGISLRLTAKNLFDSTYIIARRPEGIFTGPYRQLLVGLRWEWEAKPRD